MGTYVQFGLFTCLVCGMLQFVDKVCKIMVILYQSIPSLDLGFDFDVVQFDLFT